MKTQTMKSRVLKVLFIIVAVIYGTLLSDMLNAQTGTTNKQKMEPFTNWIGQWEGQGWSVDQSRQRTEFKVKEHIQQKLGGSAILAEGLGTNKSDGKVGFQSMGLIYYNNERGIYEIKSLLADGNMTLATLNSKTMANLSGVLMCLAEGCNTPSLSLLLPGMRRVSLSWMEDKPFQSWRWT